MRPITALLLAWPLLAALATCAAPGAEVSPLAGDFAFLEVQLQG